MDKKTYINKKNDILKVDGIKIKISFSCEYKDKVFYSDGLIDNYDLEEEVSIFKIIYNFLMKNERIYILISWAIILFIILLVVIFAQIL